MTKTHVYLRDEELEALREAAKRTGRSVAELVRDAVRQVWLRPQSQGPVALWDGEPRRTSMDHDDTIYVANLPIDLDEGVLERARSMASEQGTSLEALVRNFVESFASVEENQAQAVKTLLELSRKSEGGSGGRRWTKDELHER